VARRLAAALGLIAALALPAPALAGEPTSFVLWVGGKAPGGAAAHGVQLRPDGTGTLLIATGQVGTTVDEAGPFSPSPAQLAAIRSAADGAATLPTVTRTTGEDGLYASAVITTGGKARAVVGDGIVPAKLEALIDAVNAAVPPAAQLAAPRTGPTAFLAFDPPTPPTTAPCPPGQAPTEIGRQISLKDAANLGIVKLTAKGGIAGDTVSVEGTFDDVEAPVLVTANIEVTNESSQDLIDAAQFQQALKNNASQVQATSGPFKGTKVRFEFRARDRNPGAAPTPCTHQVRLVDKGTTRSLVTGTDTAKPQAGIWELDPVIWRHEGIHLTGAIDRYDDFFEQDGGQLLPLDQTVYNDAQLNELLAAKGIARGNGRLVSKPRPGFENDVMSGGGASLSMVEINRLVDLSQNRLVVTAKPGDIIVNKKNANQNMVVTDEFRIVLKRNAGPTKLEGLVAYCADRHRASPAKGDGFDVLGNAAQFPEPGFKALVRLAQVLATHAYGPGNRVVVGAGEAIWRITDDEPLDSTRFDYAQAKALLAAAQVPEDVNAATFGLPHFDDPNAASPATRDVTPDRVEPKRKFRKGPKRVKLPGAQLVAAGLSVATLESARDALPPILSLSVAGRGKATVAATLEAGIGSRFRKIGSLGTKRVKAPGRSFRLDQLVGLSRGAYRVVLRQKGVKARTVPFSVR
jgi:hypothetical protein